ncbi:MAG: hypothetical protein ABDI20_03635 [Candidatus Bipolaricaulaceae bacterium]
MRGLGYVLLDFLRANLRQAGRLGSWALAVALALASATALLFLPLDAGGEPAAGQPLLVLTLDPLLSEAEVNRLAWQIGGWPEALRVNFRFAGETDPEPLGERALVVEVRPGGQEALLARLAKLGGIRKIAALERRAAPAPFPSAARLGALAALVLGLGLSLTLGYRAVRRATALWREEREILRLAGLGPLHLQGPFWALGVLVGLLGAALFLLALRLGLRFFPQDPGWRALARQTPLLTGVSFPMGALLGLLGSLLRPHS